MMRKVLVAVTVVIVLTLFGGPWLTQMGAAGVVDAGTQVTRDPNQGMALALPSFFGVAEGKALYQASIADYFADGVAGIAAYTNVGKGINVDVLETNEVFQTVEDSEPGEYLIGTVVVSGFRDAKTINEAMQVHVFVQREGWIVAYLTPEQPTARIIDWSTYDDKKLSTTTLENVLQQVAGAAAVTPTSIGYYHFSHPEATDMMLVGDVIRDGNPASDMFEVKLPKAVTLYESSFSHSSFGDFWDFRCSLNGELLSEIDTGSNVWYLKFGEIDLSKWQIGTTNVVELSATHSVEGSDMANCGVAFVHGEAE